MIHNGYAYLAGPIACDNEANKILWSSIGCTLLRSKGYETHYPYDAQELNSEELREMRKTDFAAFKNKMARVVNRDLDFLSQSKIMVCLISEAVLKGTGTMSEITYAYRKGIPIYALIQLPNGIDDVPAWLCGCITNYALSVEQLAELIPALSFKEAWGWGGDETLLCDY